MHFRAYVIFALAAGFLAGVRIYLTGTLDLIGLLWNLILALLPYIFALGFIAFRHQLRWVFFALWFFFLPNSFYILTDFDHLPRFPLMVYFDTVYISLMAFAGMIAGFASLELIHREWNIHYHKKIAWILVSLTLVISMIGVYIGRFLRFNSWNLVTHPLDALREVFQVAMTNGTDRMITSSARLIESRLYEQGILGLWQFVILYGTFFFMIYAYVYHVRK